MKLKQKIGMKFIHISKKMFKGTPVHKLKITNQIYEKTFHRMYNREDLIASYKNVQFVVPSKDVTIAPSLLAGDFESQELDFLQEIAKDVRIFFDVGSNIGLYSLIYAKANPRGKVIAFEPVPENISYIRKSITLNKTKNVEIVQKAVGDKDGVLPMYISDENVGVHSMSAKHNDATKELKVKVVSIDSFVKTRKLIPELIKIDIEGYDGFAVDGALDTLKVHKPTLLIEYQPSALENCGYSSKDLLAKLFKIYKKCFVFNDKTQKLDYFDSVEEVHDVSKKTYRNLLFSNNTKHTKLIKKHVS